MDRAHRELFAPADARDRRALNLAVLAVFADAAHETTINLEQVAARLTGRFREFADETLLVDVLRTLVRTGHLLETRDESATYRDPAEFRRRTVQWQLTAPGQALLAALDAAADTFDRVASLQPAAVDELANALNDLAGLAADPTTDETTIDRLLARATHEHHSLVDNLRTFNIEVAELLGDSAVDDALLAQARDAIMDYLSRYVLDAEAPARRAAAACRRLAQVGLDVVVARAVVGANLAPALGNDDPAVKAAASRRRDVDGILEWFDGDDARFAQLLPKGRDTVLKFMRVLELRRDQRRRAASLADDLRALARGFAGAPDDAACHQLWRAATGLHPARHHHLVVDDTDGAPTATVDAADNPHAQVTVVLRRRPRPADHGGGRSRPITPVSPLVRQQRQHAHAEELAARQAARAVLARDTGARLSSFPGLSVDLLDDLAALLGAAYASDPDEQGARRAVSPDGQLEIVLSAPDRHASTHTAQITAPAGTLSGPDLAVTVTLRQPAVVTGREVAS